MLQKLQEFVKRHPSLRIFVGVVLVIFGVFAFLTPLTPGSWLGIVGLGLLGYKREHWEKLKNGFKKGNSGK